MTMWLNIENDSPEEGEHVIMTYDDHVLAGWYTDKRFYYFDEKGNIEEQEGITHWMFLPNPPGKK